jgi:dipeptidyl-peptidase 4
MSRFDQEACMHRVSRRAILNLLSFLLLAAVFTLPAFGQDQNSAPAGKSLTLERLFSAPNLSGRLTQGIEWCPDSKRISYLERKGTGKDATVELWTMDAETGQHKVLVNADALKATMQPEKAKSTQATGLGRVQAENYQWAPGGDSLLFVGSNSLALLDLRTMTPKSLLTSESEIEDPKFSPDGKWISFVRDSNLWVIDRSTGQAKALTTGGSEEILKGQLDWVYPEELDSRTAYWWSPDSSKLAYYEMDERPVTRYPIMDMSSPLGSTEYTRYPQAGESNPIARVGVVAVTGGDTKWMDTGTNTDVYLARVNWLHDSRRVAIQRLNRAQNQLDLLFCDASSGAAQDILSEKDKYWINISDDLYFFADNKRFLWSSERTGFRHFYLYDLSGKQLDQLTNGEWEVGGLSGFGPRSTQPGVDEEHGYIYFRSNKDDVLDSQLYRLSLQDKKITQITQEAGSHAAELSPDHMEFVDTYSSSMTPPRQDLYRTDGSLVVAINENKVAELAEYHLSSVEFSEVSAEDGTKLHISIIKPANFDPSKKYPVLISVYGGPHVQVVRNAWGGGIFLWHEIMAQKGYIIFSLDNRGSWGRGHAFETSIFHQLGKVELQDQLTGVRYLKSLPYVDASRIGMWGGSYGGFMTLNALFNAADVFKAGVADAPVSDWKLYDTIYTERYMGRPQDNSDGYKNSSPVNQASQLKGKLMLAHGTGDDNVHFANSTELINMLIDNGRYPDRLMIFPGRGHGISDPAARVQLMEGIMKFLLENL